MLPTTPHRSEAELTKVIAKFPRILEYKSERTIRPRLDFLKAHGVAAEDLAKVRGGGAGWPWPCCWGGAGSRLGEQARRRLAAC